MKKSKSIIILVIFASIFWFQSCVGGGGSITINVPSVVETVTARASVPLYNKSSYLMRVYVMGEKVAEIPAGASFQTVAPVPFRGTEIPIAALMYNSDGQYVGCHIDVIRLYYDRTFIFSVTDGDINYMKGNTCSVLSAVDRKKSWAVKKLPVPRLKHNLMIQVVYNKSKSGILRINGTPVKTFSGNSDRLFYIKENFMYNNSRRRNIVLDVKYFQENNTLGYSKEYKVCLPTYRPEAYSFSF